MHLIDWLEFEFQMIQIIYSFAFPVCSYILHNISSQFVRLFDKKEDSAWSRVVAEMQEISEWTNERMTEWINSPWMHASLNLTIKMRILNSMELVAQAVESRDNSFY